MNKFLLNILLSICAVSVSSCYLWRPAISNVDISAVTNDNNITFVYWPDINRVRFLRRKHYYFSGITVRNSVCPGDSCDQLLWEIHNSYVWDKKLSYEKLVSLPENITYGNNISGMQIGTPANPLDFGVKYMASIGVMGVDDNSRDRIYFSASMIFELQKNAKGETVILMTE